MSYDKPKDYNLAAERILDALENSKTPISWHEIDRPKLRQVITQELAIMELETKYATTKDERT